MPRDAEAAQSTSRIPAMAIGSDVWPGLGKTSEEAGELLQIIGKLIAYPHSQHPDGTDVLARLHDELADVAAAIDYVVWANPDRLSLPEIHNRRCKKFERFKRWHNEERGAAHAAG